MNAENEIPKYIKKKKSSTSKSREKSDHRHEYVTCLFVKTGRPYKGTYCKICGKIGDFGFGETDRAENGMLRLLENEEVFEKYKDLEQIHIDSIWQKYIPVETK